MLPAPQHLRSHYTYTLFLRFSIPSKGSDIALQVEHIPISPAPLYMVRHSASARQLRASAAAPLRRRPRSRRDRQPLTGQRIPLYARVKTLDGPTIDSSEISRDENGIGATQGSFKNDALPRAAALGGAQIAQEPCDVAAPGSQDGAREYYRVACATWSIS
ncbi:hypothetical protein HYPSUDRAFT_201880 [Hypholoma sublateritium FD-334 SS-4]|uniref:Uncharacterized protein n=1 Tax=Hypholoma sublateritium (strain FD-334 SS-4) TaxID=945553 RepID=A0A0D2L6Z7_HYPSF|nr:hypothetical protein HYPSUDRAFT_201880 [Hypholoma sublateritium FD-334 SS-4]